MGLTRLLMWSARANSVPPVWLYHPTPVLIAFVAYHNARN